MCRALYIASDKPLPLIEWNEAEPGFYVLELQENEEIVRKQFMLPYVVYAGSFEGCSCGFVYDEEPIENDEYEQQYDAQARESVRKLGAYILSIAQDASVEIFACWEGEQGQEPSKRLIVDGTFFEGTEFGFEDVTHLTVNAGRYPNSHL